MEKVGFKSLQSLRLDHCLDPLSRGLSAPGELPILLGLPDIASFLRNWLGLEASFLQPVLSYPAVSAHYSSGTAGPSGGWDLGGFPFPTGEVPGTASDLVCPACPLCRCFA